MILVRSIERSLQVTLTMSTFTIIGEAGPVKSERVLREKDPEA
jgi:hypothetical protein